MESAMGLVAFLTRSENRVTALRTLAARPRTRRELQAATGIPRATLSRILADFRDRNLASRDGHRYAATRLGERLADELDTLAETIDTTRALQTLADTLPPSTVDIDLEHFDDARVTLPTPVDPMAPVQRAADVIGTADRVRTFCYSVLHLPILRALTGVTTRGQHLEGVIATGVLDVVAADPALADRARELFASGHVELYLYDDGIEPQLVIADATTMFLVVDEDGAIRGLVETDDDAVLPWAESFFESLKADATPLDPETATERLTP